MTGEDLEARLARLREEWPVGSIAEDVVARIRTPVAGVIHRPVRRRQLTAALVASSLLVCAALAWLLLPGVPRTLQAAVEEGLAGARSAHLVSTGLDEKGQSVREDVWYRRGEGYRAESAEEIRVEDGKFQWVWQPRRDAEERFVIRQPIQPFFAGQIARMLALPDIPFAKSRIRAPISTARWAVSPVLRISSRSGIPNCRGGLLWPTPTATAVSSWPTPKSESTRSRTSARTRTPGKRSRRLGSITTSMCPQSGSRPRCPPVLG